MIAMQYSLALPADYDMSIISRRISDKGHLTDRFPGLMFKAYLSADRAKGQSCENLYAPFYVWNESSGMNDFLCGAGFVGLSQSFGWPSVKTWSVWEAKLSSGAEQAVCATREISMVPPFANLETLRKRESEAALNDIDNGGILGSVVAFEPTTWTRVRFRLWQDVQLVTALEGVQAYDVRHVSMPRA